jgi:pilus assembly protein Flp/PilA
MRAHIFLRFRKSEAGVTAIEYGLIAALIAVTLIGVLNYVYSSLIGIFGQVVVALAG